MVKYGWMLCAFALRGILFAASFWVFSQEGLFFKIGPIVKKYVAKEGYKYAEQSYWTCLKNCLKYYKELFKFGPPDPIELL